METKRYEAFGRYLIGIAIRNLPPGVEKTRANAVRYVAEALSVDASMVNSWFNGGLVRGRGSKPLTVENVKRLLVHFLKREPEYRRGLNSQAQMRMFLSLGRPEYRALLDDPEVRELLAELPVGRVAGPERDGIERGAYERIIWEFWERGAQGVILHGSPGVGKTHLMDEIHRQAMRGFEFDVIVFVAGPGERGAIETEDFLKQVVLELAPFGMWDGRRSVRMVLSDVTGRYKVLFLLDNWADGVSLKALLRAVDGQSRVLVSTRKTELALEMEWDEIEVEAYSWEEVQRYAETEFPGLGVEDAVLRELAEAAMNNPLGMQVALSLVRAVGVGPVLRALRQAPPATPVGLEGALFRFLYLAWEMLDEELREAWAKIGALPLFAAVHVETLAALWDVTVERAGGWMLVFCRDGGLCREADEQRWRMHEQVWKFAKEQLERLPSEAQERARGWLERQAALPEMREAYRRALRVSAEGVPVEMQEHFSRYYKRGGVWRALGRLCTLPGDSSEWQIFHKHPESFSSDAYVLASIDGKKDRWALRRFYIAWVIGGASAAALWGRRLLAWWGLAKECTLSLPVAAMWISGMVALGLVIIQAVYDIIRRGSVWDYVWHKRDRL